MASLRKLRTIARKQKERNELKSRHRQEAKKIAEIKMQQKEFRRGIKQALGFDRFRMKGVKSQTDLFKERGWVEYPLSTKWDRNY